MADSAEITPTTAQEGEGQQAPLTPNTSVQNPGKPLTSYSYEELQQMHTQGLLNDDEAQDTLLRKMVAEDFYGMKPEFAKLAYAKGIIDDDAAMKYIERQTHPLVFYGKDMGKGIVRGAYMAADSFNEIWNQYTPMGLIWQAPTNEEENHPAPETIPGQLAEVGSQVGVGFLAGGTVVKGATALVKGAGALTTMVNGSQVLVRSSKLAQIAEQYPKAASFVEHMATGAATDFLAFDPFKGGKLSDLIESNPSLSNPITEYLKTDPQGNVAEERLKQVLEGIFIGGALEAIFGSLRLAKGYIWKTQHGDAKMVNRVVDSGLGLDKGVNGTLASKFESAGDSAAIGYDPKGGTSYGKYQIASKPGTMEEFIQFAEKEDPEVGKLLRAAGPADTGGRDGNLPGVWAGLAKEGKIQPLEEAFIRKTHYDKAYSLLDPDVKNLVDGSEGLREVLFSHSLSGPEYAKDFNKAYQETIAQGGSLESFIDSVYDHRLSHFTGENLGKVENRFKVTERNEAKRLVMGDQFTSPQAETKVAAKEAVEGSAEGAAEGESHAIQSVPGARNDAENTVKGFDVLDIVERKAQSSDQSLHVGPAPETPSIMHRIEAETGTVDDLTRAVWQSSRDEVATAKKLGMTLEEMRASGDKMLKTIRDIGDARDFTQAGLLKARENRATLAASAKLLNTYRDEITEAASRVDSMSVEDTVKLAQHIGLYDEMYAAVEGMVSEASKTLNTLRGPLSERFYVPNAAKDLKGANVDTIREKIKLFAQAKDEKTRRIVARSFGENKWLRLALEYTQANLLWRESTHATNMLSNAASFAMDDILLKYGAIGANALKSGDLGRLRQITVENQAMIAGLVQALRVPGVMSKLFKGDISGFMKGLKSGEDVGTVWRALWTGEPVTDAVIKAEAGGSMSVMKQMLNNIPGMRLPVGDILSLSFNLLTAGDELFSTVIAHKHIAGRLFEEGYNQGLRGKNLAAYVDSLAKNPPENLLLEGLERKRQLTYTQTSTSSFMKGANLVANSVPGLVGRLTIMPFWKITANMLEFAANHTPLGLMSNYVKADLVAGGARRLEAIGRMCSGLGLMAAGFALAETGAYQGYTPSDVRDSFNLADIPSYSLRGSDGKWSDWINKLGPIGMLVNFGADFDRFTKVCGSAMSDELDKPVSKVIGAFVLMFTQPFINQSFTKPLADLANIAMDRNTDWQKFALSQADKWLPLTSLGKGVHDMMDDTQRQITSFWDLVRARYGDSTTLLPKRHELYGTVEKHPERDWWGHTIVQDKLNDPVIKEIAKVNAGPGQFAKDQHFMQEKIQLTPEQEEKAQSVLSQMPVQQSLQAIISSPGYQALHGSPETQAKLLKEVISNWRQAAYKTALASDPALLQQFTEKALKRQSNIIGASTARSATERATNLLQLVN